MLLRVLRNTTGCSIVYVRSRRRTRELAMLLQQEGISASAYHAGLAPEEKEERQNMWTDDRVRVMVATNAFGMGIDKPDVRVVVHYDLPSSLEEYYQEAGRGGRDGKEALAVAIVSRADKGTLTRRVSESFPDKEFIGHVYEMAGNFLNVAVGEGYNRVYEFDFNLFCSTFSLPPVPARSALHILGRAGYVEYIEETTSRSRLMVVMDKEDLYSLDLDSVTEDVFQCVLRMYSGLFADYVYISEVSLARALTLSTEQVYQSLLYLGRLHAVSYIPRRTTPYLYYTTSREEPRHIVIPLEVYERQRERMERRVEAMKSFVFDTDGCRAGKLLAYFGEKDTGSCGKCDLCRERRRRDVPDGPVDIVREVLRHAARPGGVEYGSLLEHLGPTYGADIVLDAVRTLASRGELRMEGTHVSAC